MNDGSNHFAFSLRIGAKLRALFPYAIPLSLVASLVSVGPGCLQSQIGRGFPERELQHRQTRGTDPRPESIETGPPRTVMECRDGSRFTAEGYRPDLCDEHGGVGGWSR